MIEPNEKSKTLGLPARNGIGNPNIVKLYKLIAKAHVRKMKQLKERRIVIKIYEDLTRETVAFSEVNEIRLEHHSCIGENGSIFLNFQNDHKVCSSKKLYYGGNKLEYNYDVLHFFHG